MSVKDFIVGISGGVGFVESFMSAFSPLGQIAIAIGVVTTVISGLNYALHSGERAQEAAIKRGKEAQQTIDNIYEDYSNKKSKVESLSSRYEELTSYGKVDTTTNENLKLSADEYSEFLNISNQIANTFPELVSGYDAEGNALLNLGSSSQSATDALEELLDQERQIADFKIAENLQDSFDGTIASIQKLQDELSNLQDRQEDIEEIRNALREDASAKDLGFETNDEGTYFGISDKVDFNADDYIAQIELMNRKQSALVDAAEDAGVEYVNSGIDAITGQWNANIYASSKEQAESFAGYYKQYLKDAGIDDLTEEYLSNSISQGLDRKEIEATWKSGVQSLIKSMSVYDEYEELGDNIKQAINTVIGNIDPVSEWFDESTGKWNTPENIRAWTRQNFVDPFSDIAKTENKYAIEAMDKIFNYDPNELTARERIAYQDKGYFENLKWGFRQAYGEEKGVEKYNDFVLKMGLEVVNDDGEQVDSIYDAIQDILSFDESGSLTFAEVSALPVKQVIDIDTELNKKSNKKTPSELIKEEQNKAQEVVDATPKIKLSSIFTDDSDTGIKKSTEKTISELTAAQEALNKLRDGESIDKKSLYESLPNLDGYAENLEEGLNKVKQLDIAKVISNVFKEGIDKGKTSTDDINAMNEYIKSAIDGVDVSTIDLSELKRSVMLSMISGIEDPISQSRMADQISKMFDDMHLEIEVDLDVLKESIANLQNDLNNLEADSSHYQNVLNYKKDTGEKITASDYAGMIVTEQKRIATTQKINKEIEKEIGLIKESSMSEKEKTAQIDSMTREIQSNNDSILSMMKNIKDWESTGNNLVVDNAQTLASTISSALSELNSETGLTNDTMNTLKTQFSDLSGKDISSLFYRSADGVKVSTSALKEFTESENKIISNSFRQEIERQRQAIENYQNQIGRGNTDQTLQSMQNDLESLLDRQAQYYAQYKKQMEELSKFNAISLAESTADQGANYDAMQGRLKSWKEAMDKGLTGTDQFKAINAYFDEWGFKSAERFQENYDKAVRYLTKDSSGLANFLSDLETLGMATHDTEKDWWTYNIKDMEEAAHQMGMGTEFFTDMFGKLEEHGFMNNYVSSMEDAALKTEDLGQQLYEATKELDEMNRSGASAEAIGLKEDEISRLRAEVDGIAQASNNLQENIANNTREDFVNLEGNLETLGKHYTEYLQRARLEENAGNTEAANMYRNLAERAKQDAQDVAKAWRMGLDESGFALNEKSKALYDSIVKEGGYQGSFEDPTKVTGEALKIQKQLSSAYADNQDELNGLKDSLSEYNVEQLKGINFSDGKYDEGFESAEKSLDSLMETLGVSAENADAFIDALTSMGLIKVAPEVDSAALDELISKVKTTDGSDVQVAIRTAFEGASNVDIDKLLNMTDQEIMSTFHVEAEDVETVRQEIASIASEYHEIPMEVKLEDSQFNTLLRTITGDVEAAQEYLDAHPLEVKTETKPQTPQGMIPSDATTGSAPMVNPGAQTLSAENMLSAMSSAGLTVDVKINEGSAQSALQSLGNDANIEVKTTPVIDESAIENSEAEVTVTATGKEEVDALKGSVEEVKDKNVKVTATTSGKQNVDALRGSINSTQSKTVNVYANVVGTGAVTSLASQINALHDKTVTVTVNKSGGGVAGDNPLGGPVGSASGTAQVKGRPSYWGYASGTALWSDYKQLTGSHAYAKGIDWELPEDQYALVNEEGKSAESIVRDGKWSIIPGGSHFEALKKGDIVFSKSQTEQLIKYGKILGNGHGRTIGMNAHADGTAKKIDIAPAHSTNGAGSLGGNSNTTLNSDYKAETQHTEAIKSNTDASKDNTDAKKKEEKATDKAKEALDKFKEKFDSLMDWIEVKRNRLDTREQLYESRSENSIGYKSKNNKLNKAQDTLRTSINVNMKAIPRYEAEIDDIIKQAVKDGIVNDQAKKKGFIGKGTKKNPKKTKDGKKTKGDTTAFLKNISAKVKNGMIDIKKYDEPTREIISLMQEYYDKIDDCTQAIEDNKSQLKSLASQKLTNIIDQFEAMAARLEHASNALNLLQERAELKGYVDSEVWYNNLADAKTAEKTNLEKELKKAQAQVKENAKLYGTNSVEFKQEYNKLLEIEEQIMQAENDLIELANKAQEVKWDQFDRLQESIQRVNEEAQFYIDIMSNERKFSKETGQATKYANAIYGLTAQQYLTNRDAVKQYQEQIDKLKEEFNDDQYNTRYLEQLHEWEDAQKNVAKSAESQKQAIKSLVKEGIDAQLSAMKTLIDRYKDMLDQQKSMYDYQNDIADQTKEIAKLQKRLSVYSGDTSEEGRANRQKTQKELAEAQKKLEETQYERYISDQKELLDKLYEQMDDALNEQLEDTDLLLEKVIAGVDYNGSEIASTIQETSDKTGVNLSTEMGHVWASVDSGSQSICESIKGLISEIQGVQSSINQSASVYAKSVIDEHKDEDNKRYADVTNGATSGGEISTLGPTAVNIDKATNAVKDSKNNTSYHIKEDGANHYLYNEPTEKGGYQDDKQSDTAINGWTVSIAKNAKTKTVSGTKFIQATVTNPKTGKTKTGWVNLNGVLDQNNKKITGYAKGSNRIKRDQWALTQEQGQELIIRRNDGSILTPLQKNDAVLTNRMTENLLQYAKTNPDTILNKMNMPFRDIGKLETVSNKSDNSTNVGNVTYQFNITGVNDPEAFMEWLQSNPKAQKMVQDMTIGQLNGKSKMAINKYNWKK